VGRVHAQPSAHKIVVGKVALGQLFLQLLRFYPVSVSQPLLPTTHNRTNMQSLGPPNESSALSEVEKNEERRVLSLLGLNYRQILRIYNLHDAL